MVEIELWLKYGELIIADMNQNYLLGGCTDAFPGNFCSLLVARSRCSGKLGCGCRKSCGFCGTTDTDSFPFLPDLGLPPLE
ncbi:unnamed protein product [Clavelina lepadiformis]|uniref:Uncharacterized protein n=1 Tax=Clavelina lepadiformis TaxID=159417 RepID=A0ABP0EVT7_CLALP